MAASAPRPIGSGPFKLDEWDPNVKEVLSANPNWAGGKTGVDSIVISVLPSESAIIDSMRANQTDFALFNDPTVATLIPGEQGMTLNRIPGLAYNVLQMNPARPPMDNLKVRQAISCAVNRQEIVDTALVGEGTVTGPLTMEAYRSDPSTLFCYTQDVEKAKALMKEAGLEGGFEVDVIAATGEPPYAANEAQVLQAQLAEIGVKLNIKTMDLKVYVDTWLKGDFDMAVAQNGGRPDPYPMYNRYFTKDGNLVKVSNFVDPELDSLLQQGRVETDVAKRKPIFQQFEARLAEQAPWVWISSTVVLYGQSRRGEELRDQPERVALFAEQGHGRRVTASGRALGPAPPTRCALELSRATAADLSAGAAGRIAPRLLCHPARARRCDHRHAGHRGGPPTEAQRASLAAYFGIDQPIIVQYGRWLAGLFEGNLGISVTYGKPVLEVIIARFPLDAGTGAPLDGDFARRRHPGRRVRRHPR